MLIKLNLTKKIQCSTISVAERMFFKVCSNLESINLSRSLGMQLPRCHVFRGPSYLDQNWLSLLAHTQKPDKFLIWLIFEKQLCALCFYLKSSSISKPEGHLVFFSFDVCAALVLTVLRVHKGPFFLPQKLAFGKRHSCKMVPKQCFLSFSF